MNFRSVADLARCIRQNVGTLPGDIDLVVGIPRSGQLAASLIALALNVKLADVQGLLHNVPLSPDNIRTSRHSDLVRASQARHILLVDDSIRSGNSMAEARQLLSTHAGPARISTCVVYATEESVPLVDFAFETVPTPRLFEWNVMHRKSLACCCVDIDGVLCLDPTAQENDDGEAYGVFLAGAAKLCIPSYPISHLVTSRLEKYRKQTEEWLHQHGIVYGELHMLDLPDAQTRRKEGAHAKFKAEVFRRARDSILFIESDRGQALEIARLAGKPVLCFTTQEMFQPGLSVALLERKGRGFAYRLAKWLYRPFKSLMSE